MPVILGLSAFYHDSAAALVVDGDIVAAAQEERFTRLKHDHELPTHAVDYCLRAAGLTPEQLDHVVFYDKPLLKFDRLLETYLAFAPQGFQSFVLAMPLWLKTKLHLPREIRKAMHGRYTKRIAFTGHHESHAASTFFPSPYEDAAILTLDGVGEWDTATIGHGRGNKIQILKTLAFPHSLGLLYSAVTYFCGFKVNSGEYKLMGLAPYGEPRFVDTMLQHLVDVKPDGSLALDMSYFNYCQGLTMTNDKFHRLFGGPPRTAESLLTQREMDLAASVQAVTEEVMLRTARHVHAQTGLKNLLDRAILDHASLRERVPHEGYAKVDEILKQYDKEYDSKKRAEQIQQVDGILANSYQYVLMWDAPFQRIAYWNRFGHPEGYLTRIGDYRDITSVWWVDPQKDADLKRAMGDNTVKLTVGETDSRYWLQYGEREKAAAAAARSAAAWVWDPGVPAGEDASQAAASAAAATSLSTASRRRV